jgi:hypothetical protein
MKEMAKIICGYRAVGGNYNSPRDIKEYEKCSTTRLGRLVANRELPILRRAKQIMDDDINIKFS